MGREWESYSPNITVPDGQSLTVRLYVWGKNGGTVGIKNPVVTGTTSAVTSVEKTQIPKSFRVSQNYPNPFNPTTEIEYAIPHSANVSIKIYNMLGQKVKTLVSGEEAAGTYSVQWNGDNDFGAKVTSGAYIYRIIAGNHVVTKKMIMMK
jgi:flagellar hook assembly protein FlgD